jgi:hypothetical protein
MPSSLRTLLTMLGVISSVLDLHNVARDALGEFGKWVAFGLAYIEDISGGKANQDGLICAIFLYPQGK